MYVLVLGWTMFTLFVPYLICIFIVIWQLNALNGFSFQLCYFSNKNIFLEKIYFF